MNDLLHESTEDPLSSAFGYRFAEWTLSIHANRLSKDSGVADLEYRQTRILVFLIERAHQIVTKEELIKTIWEKKVVNEESLPVAISQLRKALNDDARTPRFIKTIPGVGYQFIADPVAIFQNPESVWHSSGNSKLRIALILFGVFSLCVLAWKLGQHYSSTTKITSNQSASVCDPNAFELTNRNDVEMRAQIVSLRECIQRDPKHALAHLKLAEAKMWLYGESVIQPEKSDEVQAILKRSLELDPTLAYGHLWLAYLAGQENRDDRTAEIHFKKALALAPNDATIHMHYSHFLLIHKRFDEALSHLESKRDINPLTYSQTDLVWLYILQADYAKAEQELERISATEKQDMDFHIAAENVYVRNGNDQKAFTHMRWFFQNAKFSEGKVKTLEDIFAKQGMKGVFTYLYNTKEESELGQFLPPLSFARYAMFAGLPEEAKKHLKAAYDQRNIHAQCTMADPFFTNITKEKDLNHWLQQVSVAKK